MEAPLCAEGEVPVTQDQASAGEGDLVRSIWKQRNETDRAFEQEGRVQHAARVTDFSLRADGFEAPQDGSTFSQNRCGDNDLQRIAEPLY